MRLATIVLAVFAATGCVNTLLGDFSILSTDNIPLNLEPIGKNAEGSDCITRPFLFNGPAQMIPSLQKALNEALDSFDGGNALANVSIRLVYEEYLLWSRRCYYVEGDVVQLK